MRESYFKVGEEVILESKGIPRYNGEYVVSRVLYNNERYVCRLTGAIFRVNPDESPYSYLLDTPIDPDGTGETIFSEKSLRKKYPPSNLSFNQLIKECKSNVVY